MPLERQPRGGRGRRRVRRAIHERIDRGATKFLTRLHGAVCARKASRRARAHYVASLASHVFQCWWLRTFGLANAVRRVLPSEAVRAAMEREEFDASRYDLSLAYSRRAHSLDQMVLTPSPI